MTGPRLPERVVLPHRPVMLTSGHLRLALGVSRQRLHLWRRDGGFPPFHRAGQDSFTLTDEVADWCRAQGVEVIRI